MNRRYPLLILIALFGNLIVSEFVCGQQAPPMDLPGVIIDRSPDFKNVYVGCPSIVILPSGRYVASHSWFGPGTANDQTVVFESEDRGETWKRISQLDGQWWSSLFVLGDDLYIMGVNRQYGDMVIRRSVDGGTTWTEPKDKRTGLLASHARFHTAPVPIAIHQGRIWRAIEDAEGGGGWPKHFRAMVISAPIEADLLDAANWRVTNQLKPPEDRFAGDKPGWLEGNVLISPDGNLVNVLRVNDSSSELAAVAHVGLDGTLSFDPGMGVIQFPGGRSKFTVRYDPVSGQYWSLVNQQSIPGSFRNILALTTSKDFRRWETRSIVLRHVDATNHAWQYIDWQFDGDDIVAVSRTAWDGSKNAHDANWFTFHRIQRFRELTMANSTPWLGAKTATFQTADMNIDGFGFKVAKIGNDVAAFSNRKYVWQDVPDQLSNWRITQTAGGQPSEINVTAKRDCTVFFITATNQEPVDTTGWQPVPGFSLHYNDRNKTPMGIFKLQLTTGQQASIPQGNWSGGILLLPPE